MKVGRDTYDGLAVGRHEVNVLAVNPLLGVAIPVRRIVKWVGEIDSAIWANPQVIWAVE